MVDKCFSYSKMTVFKSPTLIKRFRKWRQDITKQVFCLQVPGGPEHYLLPNAQSPGLIVHQIPGVWPGGMLAAGIDSHIIKQRKIRKYNICL